MTTATLSMQEKPLNREQMPKVYSKNMPFERALRLFRKKVQNAGIIQEVRKREYYEKPTTKRKRKKAAAVKRQQKRTAEETRHLRRRPKNWI